MLKCYQMVYLQFLHQILNFRNYNVLKTKVIIKKIYGIFSYIDTSFYQCLIVVLMCLIEINKIQIKFV